MRVSSYISNSKIKKNIILIFLVFSCLVVLSNIVIDWFIDSKTSKLQYMGNKISKYKHMELQKDIYDKDIIFIGSSRTLFNISTNYFKENGLNVYNFGSSGAEMVDFPYMVSKTLKYKPEYIVISLDIYKLYNNEKLGDYLNITFEDIKALYKTQKLNLVVNALIEYLKNTIRFYLYRTSIYNRLHNLYTKYNVDFSQNDKNETDIVKKSSKQNINYDCNIFDRNPISNNLEVLKCTNGDSFMLGNSFQNTSKEKIELVEVNNDYVRFFLQIIKDIKSSGIKPIIVFEAQSSTHYSYDSSFLKNLLQVPIVDLTNLEVSGDFWADTVHMNIKGRAFYSNVLYESLKNIAK